MATTQDKEALEALEGAIRVCYRFIEEQERAGHGDRASAYRNTLDNWAKFAAGRRHFFDQDRLEKPHLEYCLHALEKLLCHALPLATHYRLGDDLWPFFRAAERLGGQRPTCLFHIYPFHPPPGQ
ncbi:MAG: hypothetical protein IPO09_09075 [Anaeromyxobacter sp.]|nr:hypothetical protein [Anaeromyxobacter sp.]